MTKREAREILIVEGGTPLPQLKFTMADKQRIYEEIIYTRSRT
ncbi:hypothetical protein J1TS3_43970 [Siminovitchia fordii]|uniref:Uncharacterized protein n=1 Tax=Siminovitchia fordii TaxID=254759 RepID=A0ABQ4KEG7_9BACI|nr:hypothetical protein J1TS3_43970 [Siminovitchia fordii]